MHSFEDCKKCSESTVRIQTEVLTVDFTVDVFAVYSYSFVTYLFKYLNETHPGYDPNAC